MIIPFKQVEIDNQNGRWMSLAPAVAVVLGICFYYTFTRLWPGFEGLAAWALWPLGIASGLFTVTLAASWFVHRLYWELLFVGKLLALIGCLMFFGASISL